MARKPMQPRHAAHGTPHQRAHDGVGGVLGDRFDDRAGDLRPVQRLRIAAAQMRQPLPGEVEVTRGEGPADGPCLTAQRRAAQHGPGGGGGQGGLRAAAPAEGPYDTGQQRGTGGRAARAQHGVQGPVSAVVTPQPALGGRGGAPERGDRMAAARIARGEIAEEAEGRTARERGVIGTHPSGRRHASARRHITKGARGAEGAGRASGDRGG
ncbi:hypothetical protein SANTM175S_03215 [Streptomyces antimycoticus]